MPARPAVPLTPQEARRLDLNAEELGVPVARLMGNAGRQVAKAVAPHLRKGKAGKGAAQSRFALILCGKGNNGGDGFAAAAELQAKGLDARVVLAEPASKLRTSAARHHLDRLPKRTVQRWSGKPRLDWAKASVIVDCLLGAGLDGEPRAAYAALIRWTNARRKAGVPVVSCDIPSGLGTHIAVHPTQTVTFHAAKPGMTPANSGRITVAPIGIPPAARHVGFGDLVAGYRVPTWDSHKGDNGIVLVVAGSLPLAGAARYVADGALRAGADLVHCVVPGDVAPLLRSWGPEPIVHAGNLGDHLRPSSLDVVAELLPRCGAVVIGPGLGPAKATRTAVRRILDLAHEHGAPVVVDADALDAIDAAVLHRDGRRMVLTPHAREFLDLAGRPATRANVVAFAKANGGVTVLRKSSVDVVSNGATTRECHRGHPTLTVGGTGDVLAGIVGALLAKGAAPFEAACAASYLLKTAGELAASVRSYGASARDVADAVLAVLARLPTP